MPLNVVFILTKKHFRCIISMKKEYADKTVYSLLLLVENNRQLWKVWAVIFLPYFFLLLLIIVKIREIMPVSIMMNSNNSLYVTIIINPPFR